MIEWLVVAVSGAPLVLAGPPGSGGGEAAIAWAHRRAGAATEVVVTHHVRATTDAASWPSMAARLARNVSAALGAAAPPVDGSDPASARAALFDALAIAGESDRRVIVVIDDVDLLDDVDGAPDLSWLPMTTGASLRLVLTTSSGRPADAAAHRVSHPNASFRVRSSAVGCSRVSSISGWCGA